MMVRGTVAHLGLLLLAGSTALAHDIILTERDELPSFNKTLACIDSCTAPYGGQNSPEETRDNNCFSIVPDAHFFIDPTDPKIPACICNTKSNSTSGYATVEGCIADKCTAILKDINFDVGADNLAHRVWEQNQGETNITKYLDAVCPGVERSLQTCSFDGGPSVECDDGEGGGPEGSLTVSMSSQKSTTQPHSSSPVSAMASGTHTSPAAAALITAAPRFIFAAGLGVFAAL